MPNAESVNVETGIVSKVTSFLSTKKGMYLLIGVLLVGVIYYYTQFGKQQQTANVNQVNNVNQEEENIPQPPPGYVTIPVEMLQGLQQGAQYQEIPQNYQEPPMNFQTQQQMEYEQQMQNQQMQQEMEAQNQQRRQVPKLKHNKQIEDDEEEEIAEQNLSKDEMESIQAQLNAMQQQRGNTNSA